MNYFTKRRIVIWAIILLSAINISAVSTIVYHVYFEHDTEIPDDATPIEVPKSRLGRFFRDELNLTREQHREFRILRQQYHQNTWDVTHAMHGKRLEILKEMSKPEPDTMYLHQLAKDIGTLHTELKMETCKFYLDMKQQCTPEQQQKLFRIFKSMIARENVAPPHKPMHNRRFGRKQRNGNHRMNRINEP